MSGCRPRRSNRWCWPRGCATTPPRCSTNCWRPGRSPGRAPGRISGSDGWIALHASDSAPLTLTVPAAIDFTDAHRAILDTLAGGGAYFFRQLAQDGISDTDLKAALWELIWAGWVTGDTFAPVRAVLEWHGRP